MCRIRCGNLALFLSPGQAAPSLFASLCPAVMMVCGFVLAWQRFYDEDKAIEEEMKDLQL